MALGPWPSWGLLPALPPQPHRAPAGQDEAVSSPGSEKGPTSQQEAESSSSRSLSLPQGCTAVEFEDCWALPQISSLGCFLFSSSIFFFALLEKFGFCLKKFTFFWEHGKNRIWGVVCTLVPQADRDNFPFLFAVAGGGSQPCMLVAAPGRLAPQHPAPAAGRGWGHT